MGINVDAVISSYLCSGSALAGVAGVLRSLLQIQMATGLTPGLKQLPLPLSVDWPIPGAMVGVTNRSLGDLRLCLRGQLAMRPYMPS